MSILISRKGGGSGGGVPAGGSNGQVLAKASGANFDTEWVAQAGGTPVFAGVRANAPSQLLASGSLSPIGLTSADTFDTDGYHNPAGDNTKLVVPTGKGGYYMIVGEISYDANATGIRGAFIEKNSTGTYPSNTTIPGAGGGAGVCVTTAAIYNLADGDFVWLVAYQNSGVGLNISGSFSMSLLGT